MPALRPFAEVYGKRGRDDHGRRSAARAGGAWSAGSGSKCPAPPAILDTDYAAKGRYAIAALAGHRHRVRARRSHGRSLARRRLPGQDSRPWKRSIDKIVGPLHAGLASAGRLSHPGFARPSHAAAHQDAQPRLRAVYDLPARASRPTQNQTYDDRTAGRQQTWRSTRAGS